MRRLITLAAFLLVISLVPLRAQRGGHASGGSHGGFSGHSGFSGHVGGMSSSGGFHGGSFAARSSSIHVASGSRFSSSWNRNDHVHGTRIYSYGYRNRCYGCWGYGYPLYGYYNPYWWSDSSSYDGDAERERSLAADMNAENLDEQRMRQQDQYAYSQPAYGPPSRPSHDDDRAKADPLTALVFRDRHVEEVRNYAIANGTLWVLNDQAAKKIPLTQLDVAATVKMNDDRGVDFQVPR
jgi:hypothetical protein